MPRLLAFQETERRSSAKRRTGNNKIRCPTCAWSPRKRDRWMCSCGHAWNTFDTRGVCPACKKTWSETQCPRCHVWSRHVDWYVEEPT